MHAIKGTNIIMATLEELEKEGYKQHKSVCHEGDLLCATTKAQDMWIKLSIYDIKASGANSLSFVILRKEA